MKTLQEKYNAILEGNFSKTQFVRDARLSLPNFITQFNGFEDTVQILKNKGILNEIKQQIPQYDKPQPGYSIEALERGVDYELEGMGLMSQESVSEEDYSKAKQKAEKNLEKDPNHYLNLLAGESKKVDKHDKYVEVKKDNKVDKFNGMKKAELKEAIIKLLREKKAKKDFDKDGKIETPEEEYKGSKDKAIKNAKKEKVQEGRRSKMKGGKVVTESDYETGGYVESMGPRLDRALKELLSVWEEWKSGPMTEPDMIPHAKKDLVGYITNKIQEQNQTIDEQYFDDLEAAKDYARKESEQGFVQHVNKLTRGGFRVEDWLDGSNTVASYEGGNVLENLDEIGMFHDPIGYKKSEPNPKDQIFTKKFVGTSEKKGHAGYIYDILKNGVKIKTIEGEGNANAYINQLKRELKEEHLKEAFKGIIKNILSEEIINEAATGNLARIADDYEDFEGMQVSINALENIVTDIESYYSKTRDKIQNIFNQFSNIKNTDGLNVGAFLGPAIQAAFMKDLAPVRDKGFTKGLELPKVKILKPGDIAEEDLDEKQTVFKPVNEGKKLKYTKKR